MADSKQRPPEVVDAHLRNMVSVEKVRLHFSAFDDEGLILQFCQGLEQNQKLNHLELYTGDGCDLGLKKYEPIYHTLAKLATLETVVLECGSGWVRWALVDPLVDAIAKNPSIKIIKMELRKDASAPRDLFQKLMRRLFLSNASRTSIRNLVVDGEVRYKDYNGVYDAPSRGNQQEVDQESIPLRKITFPSGLNQRLLAALATFSFPQLETLELESRSQLTPTSAADLRAILESAPSLCCLQIGPVGENSGPLQSNSKVWWGASTIGAPSRGNLGLTAFQEIVKGIRATEQTSRRMLTVRLIDSDLDYESASALGNVLKTRFERKYPTLLHIKGGGLGFVTRSGHYHHTDTRQILTSCLQWVTHVELDCHLDSFEFYVLMQLLPKLTSLEELRFSFQNQIDVLQYDRLLAQCRVMKSLQRLVLKYQHGASRLTLTPKDYWTQLPRLLRQQEPHKIRTKACLLGTQTTLGPQQLHTALPDIGATAKEETPYPDVPVALQYDETVSVCPSKDCMLQVSTRGALQCTILQESGTDAIVQTETPKQSVLHAVKHPKFDKTLWQNECKLALKRGKPYPLNRPTCILRWSAEQQCAKVEGEAIVQKDESEWLDVQLPVAEDDGVVQKDDSEWLDVQLPILPMTIACISKDTGDGVIQVKVQLNLIRPGLVLHNLKIVVGLGTNEPPLVKNASGGSYKHDADLGLLCWYFDRLVTKEESSLQSLDFYVAGNSSFPIQATVQTDQVLCPGVDVLSVCSARTGLDIPYQITRKLVTYTYTLRAEKQGRMDL